MQQVRSSTVYSRVLGMTLYLSTRVLPNVVMQGRRDGTSPLVHLLRRPSTLNQQSGSRRASIRHGSRSSRRSGCGGRTRPGSTLHVITRRSRYLYQRRSRATRRSSRGATTGAGLPKDEGTVASAPHLIRCLRRASLAGSARPMRQLARPPMHIWDASSTRPSGLLQISSWP